METWRQAARQEGFAYRDFNDVSAQAFIREHFDSRVENAFRACAVPAMRSDLFRLCALSVHPGLYVDADMRRTGQAAPGRSAESVLPLMPLVSGLNRGLLFRRDERIANGFIIVRNAHDPLLQYALRTAIDNIERRISNNVYVVTGPGILTMLRKKVGEADEYFKGFDMWTEEQLRPYMRMVGNLPYKKTLDHWVLAQEARSIFADGKSAVPLEQE